MKHNIYVKTLPEKITFRVLIPFALQTSVIGIGVILDSPAMQWMGFLVLIFLLFFVVVAGVALSAANALTPDQARRLIDEIEREHGVGE